MLDTEKRLYRLFRLESSGDGEPKIAKYKGDVYAVVTMTSDRRDMDNYVGAMFLKKRCIGVATGEGIKDGDILKRDGDGEYLRIISCEKKRNEYYLHLETLAVYPSDAFDFEEAYNV
jgi:hypothetical protein